MFAPLKSRSSSKLGHLGSKLGHQDKSKENIVNTLEVPFFKQSSNVCLDDFLVKFETGSHGVKNKSPGRVKGKYC